MLYKNEEILLSVIAGVFLLLFVAIVFILSIVRYKKKSLQHIKEQEQLKEQFAQTLLQSQLEIQNQTLQHISRELHDNLGQVASLIKMNLYTLKLNDAPAAEEKIFNTQELARQLITDIKALSQSLNCDRITQVGLEGALQTEVDRLNRSGCFKAALVADPDLPFINDDKATILYRMSQEVLNNAIKHSSATNLNMAMQADENENKFSITISDDGVGFDVTDKMNSKSSTGAGLHNLHHRARLINATLSMNSVIGKGTVTTITMPL